MTPHLRRADSFWARCKGLLGTNALTPDEGLWIDPCSSIHMFGMRYAIDAVFLDRNLRVVRVCSGVQPWRTARGGASAHSVLELPSGQADVYHLQVGDQLRIEA